jgi:hypothetical protein
MCLAEAGQSRDPGGRGAFQDPCHFDDTPHSGVRLDVGTDSAWLSGAWNRKRHVHLHATCHLILDGRIRAFRPFIAALPGPLPLSEESRQRTRNASHIGRALAAWGSDMPGSLTNLIDTVLQEPAVVLLVDIEIGIVLGISMASSAPRW